MKYIKWLLRLPFTIAITPLLLVLIPFMWAFENKDYKDLIWGLKYIWRLAPNPKTSGDKED